MKGSAASLMKNYSAICVSSSFTLCGAVVLQTTVKISPPWSTVSPSGKIVFSPRLICVTYAPAGHKMSLTSLRSAIHAGDRVIVKISVTASDWIW